ncbi:MAG: SDR family NAD(P)-dependent oxidoreductase [Alphaproteobacteria bacterium]
MSKTLSHILITGASSGIGQALAEHYAAPGVMLSLSGRDEERLQGAAETCGNLGAQVHIAALDVTDKEAMARWLLERDMENPVDLVIANAGISAGTGGLNGGESDEQVRQIFDVNVTGVLNTIHPLLPFMKERGRGQIAIMSSIAAYVAIPGAPAYCASKAAVKSYGQGLRGFLRGSGVKVNVICPGFVRSRMTAKNDFPMPFLMDSERAAKIIAKKLQQNKGVIVFPWVMALFCWFCTIIPNNVAGMLLRFVPSKKHFGR